ncbi:hypothetical protein BOX15_Mlig011351g1 [Macrostomum lignano]|uniref:Non-specific serine/threonine protein kinase n=2 Tax=Macrostomum lignano TaxID=282301 RepID=A0A1I8J7H5_9PLAT|nr:hypothetical protein BOX15_Mlig011351g1 [Macrostomum lignano]
MMPQAQPQSRIKTADRRRQTGSAGDFSRIERWLQEIREPDRRAMPLDFFEAIETLPNQQQHQHHQSQQQHSHAAVKYFDYRHDSGSSSTSDSDCSKLSATESETELKQSESSSESLASLNSNKMKIVREQQQQQHQQQSQKPSCPGGCGDNRVSGTSDHEQQLAPTSAKQAPDAAPNSVTCRFQLYQRRSPSNSKLSSTTSSSSSSSTSTSESACPNSRRQRHRRQLTLLRSLQPDDPALVRISAHRGVSISLGAITDDRRRPIAVSGASWRSVMEAVSDMSRAMPGLMSPGDIKSSISSSPEAAAAAAAVDASRTETEKSARQQHKKAEAVHDDRRAHAATPPTQIKATEQRRNQGADRSSQHRKKQRQSEQPDAARRSSYKLAQNVRFQLITPQRESMFEQDSTTGKPVHPRLRHLLDSMGMDMVFLERTVGPNNVPSVKVRFLLNKFEQLTAFCSAIDYQLPKQGST